MNKFVIVSTTAILALTLTGCGTQEVDSKRPSSYTTPASSPTIKVGDKCKKSGEKKTVNGQKLVCKKVGKYSTRKWYKA